MEACRQAEERRAVVGAYTKQLMRDQDDAPLGEALWGHPGTGCTAVDFDASAPLLMPFTAMPMYQTAATFKLMHTCSRRYHPH